MTTNDRTTTNNNQENNVTNDEQSAPERSRDRLAFLRRRSNQITQQIKTTTDKESTDMRNKTSKIAISVIAAAPLIVPFATATANASFNVGDYCVRASMDNNEFTHVKGGCGIPEGGNTAPEVPDVSSGPVILHITYNVPQYAEIWVIDNQSGQEYNIGYVTPGRDTSRDEYFDPAGGAEGYTIEARSIYFNREVIARGVVNGNDRVNMTDDSERGFAHVSYGTINLVNEPVTLDVSGYIHTGANTGAAILNRPFSYSVIETATGEIVGEGSGIIGERQFMAANKKYVIAGDHFPLRPDGRVQEIPIPAWTVTFTVDGQTYSSSTVFNNSPIFMDQHASNTAQNWVVTQGWNGIYFGDAADGRGPVIRLQ